MKTYTRTIVLAAMLMVWVAGDGLSQTKIDSKALPLRSEIVPQVDHHTHLLGPYALPLPDPLPPEIKLPAELDRLLTDP
jgi:hypothetical protein